MKKIKCKVCNTKFVPKTENHYIARTEQKTGFSALAGSTEPDLFDAFDCPQCGCQMFVNQRMRAYEGECFEDDSADEEVEAE